MRLLFLGDIHNEFNVINRHLKKYDIRDANIVQVGDFGVGFYSEIKDQRHLEMTHDVLVKRNVFLYVVRGNHDNPLFFKTDPFNFTNIKFVPDYTVLNLSDKNILFIGGAHSIDRTSRTNGYDWWEDETVVYDEEKIKSYENVDIVITHSCDYNEARKFNFINNIAERTGDDKLISDVQLERYQLKNLFYWLSQKNKIEMAFCGHFHISDTFKDDFGINHRVLDINEFWEDNNYDK